MDIDRKGKFYCDDDGESHVCDKLAMDRYYNNHLKPQTHIYKIRKRQ